MSVTFTTKYGGTTCFIFYSFRQIVELCRNKANYADLEVDMKAFFQKYLHIEKTWFERSKNPRYKKVIYPIERIFLANEDYKQANVDARFAGFVRETCVVVGRWDWMKYCPEEKAEWIKFRSALLAPVNATERGQMAVAQKYEDVFKSVSLTAIFFFFEYF